MRIERRLLLKMIVIYNLLLSEYIREMGYEGKVSIS